MVMRLLHDSAGTWQPDMIEFIFSSRMNSGDPDIANRIYLPTQQQEVIYTRRSEKTKQKRGHKKISYGAQELMKEYQLYYRTFMRASLEIDRSAMQIESCRSVLCCPRVHVELFGPFQKKWLHSSLRRSVGRKFTYSRALIK
jgi:hypothetical protein